MTPRRFLEVGTWLTLGLCPLVGLPGCFVQYNQTPDVSEATSTATDPNTTDAGRTDPNAAPASGIVGNVVAAETAVAATPAEQVGQAAVAVPSGALTAGSLNDNLNFDTFRAFISEVLQADDAGVLPNVPLGRRIVVSLRDGLAQPVGDARVLIQTTDEPPRTILDRNTGSDGRLVFLTDLDDGTGTTLYTLAVFPPDGSAPLVETRMAQNLEWDVTFDGGVGALPRQLDLAFVIDTTQSMTAELTYLKTEVRQIAEAVAGLYPSVTQRYALIAFRDLGDVYVARSFDFTGSLDEFANRLSAQTAEGGGDVPEALHQALEKAAQLNWQPPGSATARVLFVITDAPPHLEFARRAFDALQALRGKAVAMYPIAASVAYSELEFLLRVGAFLTLGEYSFLTDDAGLGTPHARPDLPCYYVEQLDVLMTRQVRGVLSGTRVEADAANIIRTVGNPVDGVCSPAPAAAQ
jgi:hypothetical protein